MHHGLFGWFIVTSGHAIVLDAILYFFQGVRPARREVRHLRELNSLPRLALIMCPYGKLNCAHRRNMDLADAIRTGKRSPSKFRENWSFCAIGPSPLRIEFAEDKLAIKRELPKCVGRY
jgi:hypothetical protein